MTESTLKFSLLLCTYAKENPQHLSQCLESILAQTVLPDELLIVKDGPLPHPLESVISGMSFPNILTVIALPQNVSQGLARAEGLKCAKYKWIAIMDSDDVCLPTRFEKQIAQIKANPKLDLIGGQVIEFDAIPGQTIAKRNVPTTHSEILTFAKKRNPFSMMTTMFKRDLALESGNFRYFPGFEDYDLWARMISNGAICANHPDVLVHVRVGNGMYARRKGLVYIRSEWRMQILLRKLGITNLCNFIGNIATRIPIRLLPHKGLEFIYKHFARST